MANETLVRASLPKLRSLHVTPLGEVRITPPAPTATKVPEAKVTSLRLAVVGAVVAFQVKPSGEVTTVPALPTTMWRPAPNVVLLRVAEVPPRKREVQLEPSGEVRIRPEAPTAIQRLAANRTPLSELAGTDVGVQVAPWSETSAVPTPPKVLPTATNRPAPKAISLSWADVPEVRLVQRVPSLD